MGSVAHRANRRSSQGRGSQKGNTDLRVGLHPGLDTDQAKGGKGEQRSRLLWRGSRAPARRKKLGADGGRT